MNDPLAELKAKTSRMALYRALDEAAKAGADRVIPQVAEDGKVYLMIPKKDNSDLG